MQKRYPALHIISLLFKVLAVVTISVGITLIVIVLSQGGAMSVTFFPEIFGSSLSTLGVVPIILFSLVGALILWGVAELLVCVVDIENNTRARATTPESLPKETPPAPVAITPVAEIPTAQPAPTNNPPEESEDKKAATMAARKQAIKDILNKRLW